MTLEPGVSDLVAFELFLAAIETGSLSKAAERHGLAQPSVSERIRTLEQRLGVPLLRRSASGVTPTPAGQTVACWAQELSWMRLARWLKGSPRFGRPLPEPTRVAVCLTVAEHFVPSWLVRMRAERPDVSLEFVAENSDQVIRDLRSGVVDLGFVDGPELLPGLQYEVVAEDEVVVLVAPHHPWAQSETPIGPAELAGTPLVLREEGSGTRKVFEFRLAELGLRIVKPAVVLVGTAPVRATVLGGVGPGVLSRRSVNTAMKNGWLVNVSIDGLRLDRELRAVWRKGQRPAVLALLTELEPSPYEAGS